MELKFPIILDGANGTELQKRGMPAGVCTEQWVIDNPWAMIDLQGKYVAAGSNVVYAPTFTATENKLAENGIVGKTAEYNKKLVGISREAVQGRALVSGDMSPVGKFLIPFGSSTFEEMYQLYLEQAAALEEAGVDMFACETMTSLPEIRAAVLACKAVSRKPVIASITCDEKGRTLTGSSVCAAAQVLEGLGVDAVGLNCSFGPDKMLEQIRKMSEYTSLPLLAKPNAGFPKTIDGKLVYDMEPEELGEYYEDFAAAGVALFGACCGSDDRFIKVLADSESRFEGSYDTDGRRPYNTGMDEMLPLATEREAFWVAPDVVPGVSVKCDGNLELALEEAIEDSCPVVAVEIGDEKELEIFTVMQHEVKKPLCIRCEDGAILEKALRAYQGRAMYDGSLSEDVLEPLAVKYGLVY